jgi:hypothetical protein
VLTEAGRGLHTRGLALERKTYETERMTQAYERFVPLDEHLEQLAPKLAATPRDPALLAELSDAVSRAKVPLRRTTEQLLRFEQYLPRLRHALADEDVAAVYAIWRELHADYLLTLGIPR